MTFALDPRLAGDSLPLGDLALCRVLVMADATYPWLVLVPRRPGLAEIIDLEAGDRARLMEEIALASTALRAVTGAEKLNVAALGNMVRQLHVHVIARFAADAAWPGPVWGKVPARAYAAPDLAAFRARLVAAFGPSLAPHSGEA